MRKIPWEGSQVAVIYVYIIYISIRTVGISGFISVIHNQVVYATQKIYLPGFGSRLSGTATRLIIKQNIKIMGGFVFIVQCCKDKKKSLVWTKSLMLQPDCAYMHILE